MKKVIYTLLALGGIILTTLMSIDDIGLNQSSFEQAPPIPLHYYVQKIEPQDNGENMIMSVQYLAEENLANEIQLFENGAPSILLKDNGIFPDDIANDYKYASLVQENIPEFLDQIKQREDKIEQDGGIMLFKGHSGEFLNKGDLLKFDYTKFNNNEPTEVYNPILSVSNCETQILKQNSLFITDLTVVEDPSRTFNVFSRTGNPIGAWTFGTMMKNMANESTTQITTIDFIKHWLIGMGENQNLNGIAIEARTIGLAKYWITNARKISGDPNYNTTITSANWEAEWDATNADTLIKYAPFKLMAIVNRLDLRANYTYLQGTNNAGETRFIYTLVDPETGNPPAHFCIGGSYAGGSPDLNSTNRGIDWVGMNVILEYGNPQKNVCDVHSFAQQWYDLSAFPLGTSGVVNEDYNSRLQAITDKVTLAGKGGSKNVNKSAINQIRTNEKMFGPVGCGTNGDWEITDWQLRQFEIGNDGYLYPALLTNTPRDERNGVSYNVAENILRQGDLNLNSQLLNWIYGSNMSSPNIQRVQNGSYNLPPNFQAVFADIIKEKLHFFGFDWNNSNLPIVPLNFDPNQDMHDTTAKNIRHQISLNTCQGCHSGETKTNFTQMMPRGYGEPANYWDAIPSFLVDSENHTNISNAINGIDARAFPDLKSNGFTSRDVITNNGGITTLYQEHDKNGGLTLNTTNQIVSPFLTGRLFSSETSNHWQDDDLNDDPSIYGQGAEGIVGLPMFPLSDEKMNGLYYVNDPSNVSATSSGGTTTAPNITSNVDNFGLNGAFPQLHNRRNGFNDLQRRSNDLCRFLKKPCVEKYVILDYMEMIGHMPFPKGGH